MYAGGYGVSEWNHLKIIVHLFSYGNAEVSFLVEWTELQLLRVAIISDRWGVPLVGMVSQVDYRVVYHDYGGLNQLSN